MVDNLDGPSGSLPDPALWDYDTGPWQDDGLQRYTTSPDNVRLDGQGHLVIQARQTPEGYTSARPVTRGKLSMLYGSVGARIKFPAGQAHLAGVLGCWARTSSTSAGRSAAR